MSNLAVKTKNDSSPQGKPRVYFSCHPDDLEKHFDLLSGEIFNTQDCAIYYESDWSNEADPEDLKLLLSDMQLFVFPITTNFLTKPSRARDFEYGLAKEQHTPILPIAMEPGLDKLFSKIMNRVGKSFGEVQFLDHTLKDVTAITYAEKLEKKLESILIGDELTKRVRAAFDAYIFLSYRKKDRTKAKNLMSLIHSIPYCRDIAIWYDEFLIPGEVWNYAIAEAMTKSVLVVLAVTPNLTEPGNYIIKHEYPAAVEKGKDVVPIELFPTDTKKLKILFPGIADVINGKDVDAVSAAFSDELQKFVQPKNTENPEHNYLIGLAYLGGIDVECDPEKAVELIKSAAEKDFPEAIEKLASLYHDGNGVKRDYEEEVVWLQRMVDVRKKTYEESKDEKDGRKLTSACWNLGDALYNSRKLYEAKKVYECMMEFAKKIFLDHPNHQTRMDFDISYKLLKNVIKFQGKFKEAAEEYRKDFMLSKKLSEEPGTIELQRDLSLSYEKLGNTAKSLGKLKEAEAWYRKGFDLREELCEESGTIESRRDLNISYNNLGDIANSQGKLKEAEEWYRKGLDLREELCEETRSIESRRDLSVSYNRLGDIANSQEKLKEAEGWYRKGLNLREELCEESGSVESQRDLTVSYNNLGDTATSQGKLKEAEAWYRKGLDLRERLCEESGSVESRRDLSVSFNKLGGIARLQEKLEEAEEWYRKNFMLSLELNKEMGTVETFRDLSVAFYNLGIVSYYNKNVDKAVYYLEQAIITLEILDDPCSQKNLESMKNFLNKIEST